MARRNTHRLATVLFTLAWLIAAYAVAPKTQTAQTPLVQVKLAQAENNLAVPASTTTTRAAATQNTAPLYPVVHVVDGDTIDVQKDGKKVRVRLIGINAPESVDPRRPVQCFGKEASAEMSRVVGGQSVHLETDPSQDTYDKYGRLLAYVFLPDSSNPSGQASTNVNLHMIEAGYAYEYTYHLPYRYQKEFKAAQTAAEKSGSGLWAAGTCGH